MSVSASLPIDGGAMAAPGETSEPFHAPIQRAVTAGFNGITHRAGEGWHPGNTILDGRSDPPASRLTASACGLYVLVMFWDRPART